MALQKHFKDKVILQEGQQSKYFFIVKSGEVELCKRVRKGNENRAPNETLMSKERVRITDSNHGIERYNDETLEQENHCIEGDDTGILGGSTK